MKKKLIICSLILLTLILFSWSGIWLAHTRIIEGGLLSLKNKAAKEGVTLEYGKLDFTMISSPLHLKTQINSIRLYNKSHNVSYELNIEGFLLDSDLLNKKLSIILLGNPTSKDIMVDKINEGLYAFEKPPVVKCLLNTSFNSLSDFNFNKWYSMERIEEISVEEVYYTYSTKEGDRYLPFTKAGPISILLKEKTAMKDMQADLEFKFLNHIYITKPNLNESEEMQKVYKMIEEGGANDVTFKIHVSNDNNEKLSPADDSSKDEKNFVNINVENFHIRNNNYDITVDGDVLKAPDSKIPYFALNLSIKGFDKMISIYTDVIEATVGNQAKEKAIHDKEIVKNYSKAISKILKDISLSTEKDKLVITLFHKKPEILIANVSFIELMARLQEQVHIMENKSGIAKKEVVPW